MNQETPAPPAKPHRAPPGAFAAAIPGVLFCAALAAVGYGLSRAQSVVPISPMMFAIGLAIAWSSAFGPPMWARAGNGFTLRRLLRLAIVLLGLQLTANDVGLLGVGAIALVFAAMVSTFFFTRWFGGVIGVDRGLSELIASGTAICGASAIVATNSVTRAPQEDVIYSVACVTFFGTLAMFLLPALYGPLGLSPLGYGVWAGGSIHEVAQVVAAGFQVGPSEGEAAMVAKLLRVAAMAPMILWLGAMQKGKGDGPAPPIPWFVVGFAALIIVNSALDVPVALRQGAQLVTVFLLTMSLAALGLETDLRKLRLKGPRPLALGAAGWVCIMSLMLAGVWLLG